MKPANQRPLRNWLWSVPVGLQLSVIYALLVTVTLALLGWALYVQLDSFLVSNTVDRLQRAARPNLVRFGEPSPGQGQGQGRFGNMPPGARGAPLTGTQLSQQAFLLVQQLSASDVAVAVLDSQGQIIASTQSPTGEIVQIPALPADWSSRIANGLAAHWIVSNPGSDRQLVLLTPIEAGPIADQASTGSLYLEQIASLAAADSVLTQLRIYIALGTVIGTLIGIIAGLALTRVILRPLDRVVRTAEGIAAGDLHRRLRLPSGRNEIARLGSAFDHMVDRLAAALEAQRRFVADASHELRTPLTSMEGLSEMLLIGADRGDATVVQRTVRSIHKELGRLGRLVSDLLTLSRLDSTTPMTLAPLDAGKLMGEVAEQLQPLAAGRDVRLDLQCPGPVVVRAEPDKLKQVVLNIVDNAIRYSPQGEAVTLTVAADAARREARIEVQDMGPGIAAQDLPHIFDRFYRGDTSRARSTGNAGLGLAIARAIVDAHGGWIEARSAPGAGARFTVVLPLAPSSEVVHPPPVETKAPIEC